jgi:hypothetical protein
MIDPKALEAARRINNPNTPTDTAGFIADAVSVANSLLTASQARDEIVEECAKVAHDHLDKWADDLLATWEGYIEAQTTGTWNGRRITKEQARHHARAFRERAEAVAECADHTAKAITSLKTGDRDAG